MSEWKITTIEASEGSYAKDVRHYDNDPQMYITGSEKRGESYRTSHIWISKQQIKDIYELIVCGEES